MSFTETPPTATHPPSEDVACPDCPATFETEAERDHHHGQAHGDAPASILHRVDPGSLTRAATNV